MKFCACPHDIVKQMETWLRFATWLQHALGEPVAFEPVTDFEEFYERVLPQAELCFVNPMDAWFLVRERDFRPLFRTELYDEVVFIAHVEDVEATLQDFDGQPIAAVERQFATYLGLYLFHEQGIHVAQVVFRPSWLQVIHAVMQKEVPYGLLYQDFYHGLSHLAREQFRVVHESQTRYATHMMLLHPQREDVREQVYHALATMHEDPEGAALLNTLRLGRWVPVQDLGMIERIVQFQLPAQG